MMLYGPDLQLLKERRLASSPSTDLWAAQSTDEGNGIVLRHASASSPPEYQWLNPDTLETSYRMQGCRGCAYSIGGGVAGQTAVFERTRNGIRMMNRNGEIKVICDNPLCREAGDVQVISAKCLGWSSRTGIAVVDIDRGLVWSKSVQPQQLHKAFQFGSIRPSLYGTKFALWVVANRRAAFEGFAIRDVTFLVYDVSNLDNPPAAIRVQPTRPDWDFALSPSSSRFAVFDGEKLLIYSLH